MINLERQILDSEGNPSFLTHKGTRELEALKQNPKLEFPETVKTVIKAALRSIHSTSENWLKHGKIEYGLMRMHKESKVKDDFFTQEEKDLIRQKLVDYTLTLDGDKETGYFPPFVTYQVLEELKLLN